MSNTRHTRWSFEAVVDAADKVRLRGFVRNEIAYYNALLGGFASRLRTMPDIFTEVNEDLLGEVAAHGYNLRAFTSETLPASLKRFKNVVFFEDRLALSDRVLLLLDAVSVGAILHPETRRAIAIEMLRAHRQQADALSRTSSRVDQVLTAPVELLHPLEPRTKRHIQLPARAMTVYADGKAIGTAYNNKPIVLHPAIPADAKWDVVIIRENDRPDKPWTVELRQDRASYLLRQTDAPLNKKSRRRTPETAR